MDDWCAIGATIIAIGMIVSMDIGVKYGTGKSESSNLNALEKTQLSTQVLYILSSGMIKLSILFLYRRIFPTLRITIIVSIVLIVLISIAFLFVAIFQCKPTAGLWITGNAGHTSCVSLLVFWCDVAVVFLITNIWIVVLPVKPILGLHLAFRKRMVILGLLCSTGILACTAAAIRLAFVIHLYKGHDPSWDIVPIYLCSVVEVSTALIASSIPALRQGLPKCRGYFARAKKRLSETPQKLESGSVSTTV
jgi:hypothetical protein